MRPEKIFVVPFDREGDWPSFQISDNDIREAVESFNCHAGFKGMRIVTAAGNERKVNRYLFAERQIDRDEYFNAPRFEFSRSVLGPRIADDQNAVIFEDNGKVDFLDALRRERFKLITRRGDHVWSPLGDAGPKL